ncbi:ABC transporter ATP-binding protein [Nocardiopsis sp. NRRL B-16309]|uniref:ABC transporter ATP-binding protein n=1 Tax=Nocardiopsis sp. NRRL B-16309 TaxID=1519494 RepID=UPI0006ADE44B
MFQSFHLLPALDAEENITFGQRLSGQSPDPAWQDELVRSPGLEGRLRHRPTQFSGGQRQRVAVARALLHRPSVVFADEPTGNLDSRSGGRVLAALRGAAFDHGRTVVMVTHDPAAGARRAGGRTGRPGAVPAGRPDRGRTGASPARHRAAVDQAPGG